MTKTITDETRLTVVKHLAGGKTPDVVAAITRLPRGEVVDIGNHHGYPDTAKLLWAADVLSKKADEARRSEVPEGTVVAPTRIPRAVVAVDSTPAATTPDSIAALLASSKAHPSKRINNAADKVYDAVDRLKALIAEDEQKHAAKRQAEAKRAAARAEIDRLTKALAEAKAKMRGATTTLDVDSSVSAADLRAWAKSNGVECPAMGRIPAAVREQYAATEQTSATA